MQLAIGNKEYNFRFGIKFIRELDKKYYIEKDGLKFGAALELKIPLILTGDAVALAELLYAATVTETKRPSQDSIDEYVENTEDIDGLFTEVVEELKKGNATKLKMQQVEKSLKDQKK